MIVIFITDIFSQGLDHRRVVLLNRIETDYAEAVSSAMTKWTFNSPRAQHMDGIWERMVGLLMEAMLALNNDRKLTDEILMIIWSEAGDMLNTRSINH